MLYLIQLTSYPHCPRATHFKAHEYFVVPLVNTQKTPNQTLICKCHEVHIVILLHVLTLALVHSTVLIISPLKNSCANEAACGSREKENWQDSIKAI